MKNSSLLIGTVISIVTAITLCGAASGQSSESTRIGNQSLQREQADSEVTRDSSPLRSDIRSAVERSLPYIAERGEWWIEKKECISCHRTTFSIWAYSAAADAGIKVDTERLNGWIDWSYEALLNKNDKDVIVATVNLDGTAQLLHASSRLSAPEGGNSHRDKLIQYLIDGQQEDGSWTPHGQLPAQKRPRLETTFVSTAWNSYYAKPFGLGNESTEAARKYLDAQRDFVSTEAVVVSLLSASAKEQRTLLLTLRDEQNSDGGWGWIRGQESDALATGQVLFGLSTVADRVDDQIVSSAVRFLVSTQSEDGNWPVKGTKKAKQKRVEETATYWGTCWAVIGLLEVSKS